MANMTMLITRSWLYILKDGMADNPKSLEFCKITMHIIGMPLKLLYI